MRWNSPAKPSPFKWHQWFAWYPKRFPSNRYENGQWVWLEYVWRKRKFFATIHGGFTSTSYSTMEGILEDEDEQS